MRPAAPGAILAADVTDAPPPTPGPARRLPVLSEPPRAPAPAHVVVRLRVNGRPVVTAVPAHHTLLELLRETLDLTGSKQGCDKGDCGACTVQVDGVPRLACLTLAVMAEGCDVRTVEGLADGFDGAHPLQDAFDRYDAAQCGFCTPGILMAAEALLRAAGRPVTHEEVREALAGNLCRCTGYTKILDAVVDASRALYPGTMPGAAQEGSGTDAG